VRRGVLVRCLAALGVGLALAGAARAARAGEEPQEAEGEADEEEDEGLRQRLTEREDQRRPVRPWSVLVAGRPLTVSGEYELELGYLRRRVVGPARQHDRFLLEQTLEVETFYSFGTPLSLFAQLRLAMEEDLLPHTFDGVSDGYLERGEMWVHSEDIGGSHLNFELGRLDFEDERRWWWDDELDAVRVGYERETFEVTLALARELAPERTDPGYIDPAQEDVLRVLGEASWDWRPDHAVELFLLHQDDGSPAARLGQVGSIEREDESDARLTWLGLRLLGVLDLRGTGLLGYWLDTGWVWGEERFADYEPVSEHRSAVEAVGRRSVSGFAVDAGLSWILPFAHEPRVYGGLAFGSRDYRQTGVEANEAGYGGAERFPHYGALLDPELSNLAVLTLGAGVTLLRSSSLDLVYHAYRQAAASESLPDARIEATLGGRDRDLGQELDLVLALEEWERLEFLVVGSVFRAGDAFGPERGTWSYGGAFAVRVAF
jgi:alginate production protein